MDSYPTLFQKTNPLHEQLQRAKKVMLCVTRIVGFIILAKLHLFETFINTALLVLITHNGCSKYQCLMLVEVNVWHMIQIVENVLHYIFVKFNFLYNDNFLSLKLLIYLQQSRQRQSSLQTLRLPLFHNSRFNVALYLPKITNLFIDNCTLKRQK